MLPSVPSHEKLLDGDLDDGDPTEFSDLADVANADAFKELTQNNSFFCKDNP